mmetsp:Transcript_30112/g.44498  ORF Transcript_30112/g.44498 Transcript_30112/m.44498 type:complete len:125 (-) Transcript_30112:2-376(-)
MISLRGIVQKSDSNDEWKWSGMWTFGPLPHHVGRDVHSSQLKIPNVRPFVYTFTESCTASSVAVPSLEEEEEEEDETTTASSDLTFFASRKPSGWSEAWRFNASISSVVIFSSFNCIIGPNVTN